MTIPQEIIKTKRNGNRLSEIEIRQFVQGLVDGRFSEGQVAALAMAVYLNGMTTEETVALTLAMRDSGAVLNWRGKLNGPVVDKHSTGGVGDKVTLMLAPMIAACGAYMPSITGRGLGHTGGTVDKLESIPGYNCNQPLSKIQQVVSELGCIIVGQSAELAPADKRLYGIRDVTATVESIPLITASILSKKLAEGLDVLVMDVKTGNGALMQTMDAATALAASIVNTAKGAGVATRALLTDMNEPLGLTAGNALEIIETLDYLSGKYCEPRLHQIVLELGANMLMLAGLYASKKAAVAALEHSLSSGKATEIFAAMVSAVGGPTDLFERPEAYLARAPVIQDIVAQDNGVLGYIDTVGLGMAVVRLGGGRSHPAQVIDPAVGFSDMCASGTKVTKGDVIARVHAASAEAASKATAEYQATLTINSDVTPFPMIHRMLG